VTGSLENIFCVNEIKGYAMGVVHGIDVEDEKSIPNVSGKT
jgi:hypothetical protein